MPAKKNKSKNQAESFLPKYKSGAIEEFSKDDRDRIMLSCVGKVKDIVVKEHYVGQNPFNDEKALALDDYAQEQARKRKSESPNSVDMVVGCEKHVLFMIEAKINSQSVKQLPDDIKEKIIASKKLLQDSENYQYHVHQTTGVLLNDKNFEVNARELMQRMDQRYKIKPMTVIDMYNNVFVKE